MLDLQALIQLLAAIYLSLSVESLSDKLYKVSGKAERERENILSKIRVNSSPDSNQIIVQKLVACNDRIIRIDLHLILWLARIGFIISVTVLLFCGLHKIWDIAGICNIFFEDHWIVTTSILVCPALICLFLFNRPCRWISRTKMHLDKFNSKVLKYLELVSLDEMDKIPDKSLKNRLLHGSNEKKAEDYLKDVTDWRDEKIKKYFHTRIWFAFIARLGIEKKKIHNSE